MSPVCGKQCILTMGNTWVKKKGNLDTSVCHCFALFFKCNRLSHQNIQSNNRTGAGALKLKWLHNFSQTAENKQRIPSPSIQLHIFIKLFPTRITLLRRNRTFYLKNKKQIFD